MFINRSFNIIIALIIIVLALLSIGTEIYSRQANPLGPLDWYLTHAHAVPSDDANAVTAAASVATERSINTDDAPLKDRPLEQMNASSTDVAADLITAQQRYAELKNRQLERTDSVDIITAQQRYAELKLRQQEQATAFPIAVTSAKPTSAERYANFKNAQLERVEVALVDAVPDLITAQQRYAELKVRQLEQATSMITNHQVAGVYPSAVLGAGRARYLQLKEAQLD